MKTATLSQGRLRELLEKFPAARVAVAGDFFLDKYLEINPAWNEPSLETGKTAYQVASIRVSPGAAGTVVSNLAALGAGEIHAVGLMGQDGEGFELRRALELLGCTTGHLHASPERFTPTYLKPRDITHPGLEGEHSRYDTQNRSQTPAAIEKAVLGSLESLISSVDAVVVLDQVEDENCGVVTAAVREAISRWAQKYPQVVFWADSRRRIHEFRNVLIKPNQYEALNIGPAPTQPAISLEELHPCARQLYQAAQAPVFVTRGSQGMLICEKESYLVPQVQIEGPTDPTGAGDSVTVGSVLALCSGATPAEAGIIGNLVASLTVQQLATTGTADPSQLPRRLDQWLEQTAKNS